MNRPIGQPLLVCHPVCQFTCAMLSVCSAAFLFMLRSPKQLKTQIYVKQGNGICHDTAVKEIQLYVASLLSLDSVRTSFLSAKSHYSSASCHHDWTLSAYFNLNICTHHASLSRLLQSLSFGCFWINVLPLSSEHLWSQLRWLNMNIVVRSRCWCLTKT